MNSFSCFLLLLSLSIDFFQSLLRLLLLGNRAYAVVLYTSPANALPASSHAACVTPFAMQFAIASVFPVPLQ